VTTARRSAAATYARAVAAASRDQRDDQRGGDAERRDHGADDTGNGSTCQGTQPCFSPIAA
jgi:hypothetical protein